MPPSMTGPRLAPRSGTAKQLVVFLHGYGADGNDLIDGGVGIDTASWSEAPAHRDEFGDRYGMQINLAAGKAVALTGFFIADPTLETDTLRGIENAIGSAYQDLIYGDARANMLWGGGARDEISGGGGGDRLYGEAGDDNLGGDDGNDRHYGGKGNDFLQAAPATT